MTIQLQAISPSPGWQLKRVRDHEQILLSHQKLLTSFDMPDTIQARLSCHIGLLQECRNGVGGPRRSHPR